ncbi:MULTISPECIES: SsgA family sporulation/cell division regulator [unclassified Crossiella]|uniref:SsgA family sporulation/cell division regulator n=1 Tax=unclassified Crossiella TaxID=2620835 RepID=UPI001FFFE18E|nr:MULTISPECIES: SsgA family sporulation/cell division regulator [unclassified Crossiella]MCK2239537.1 SsgA family sporulation/cell division regulator [Crossiella sp. S99.2]MCK2252232.1 SsgA family sporulation/cell division regulator [Crossiella sp. S99.1]
MREDHAEIETTTMFNLLVAPPVPVEVELGYSTTDPYAVRAVFNPGGSASVEWILARDLLADGLISDSGEGDVRMWPILDQVDQVVIEFTTPAGHARFTADAEELADFLNRSYELVAPGSEHEWFDFEHELTHLGNVN